MSSSVAVILSDVYVLHMHAMMRPGSWPCLASDCPGSDCLARASQFPLEDYSEQLGVLRAMSRKDAVAYVRRRSDGFSRGASQFRGVTRHHGNGNWEARIGKINNRRYVVGGWGEGAGPVAQ